MFSISFSFLIIFLLLPFVTKWFLTSYLPAWSELFDILRSAGKK